MAAKQEVAVRDHRQNIQIIPQYLKHNTEAVFPIADAHCNLNFILVQFETAIARRIFT